MTDKTDKEAYVKWLSYYKTKDTEWLHEHKTSLTPKRILFFWKKPDPHKKIMLNALNDALEKKEKEELVKKSKDK